MEPMIDYRAQLEAAQTVIARLQDKIEHFQWRPIAEAPRDRTRILLLGTYYERPWVAIGEWSQSRKKFKLEVDSNLEHPRLINPTHFMPLPSPPSDGGG